MAMPFCVYGQVSFHRGKNIFLKKKGFKFPEKTGKVRNSQTNGNYADHRSILRGYVCFLLRDGDRTLYL
jgi:hypothetical protein